MYGGVRSLCTAGSLRGDAAARLRAGLAGGRGGGRRLFQGETAACMDRQVEALARSNLGADVRGQACSVGVEGSPGSASKKAGCSNANVAAV